MIEHSTDVPRQSATESSFSLKKQNFVFPRVTSNSVVFPDSIFAIEDENIFVFDEEFDWIANRTDVAKFQTVSHSTTPSLKIDEVSDVLRVIVNDRTIILRTGWKIIVTDDSSVTFASVVSQMEALPLGTARRRSVDSNAKTVGPIDFDIVE